MSRLAERSRSSPRAASPVISTVSPDGFIARAISSCTIRTRRTLLCVRLPAGRSIEMIDARPPALFRSGDRYAAVATELTRQPSSSLCDASAVDTSAINVRSSLVSPVSRTHKTTARLAGACWGNSSRRIVSACCDGSSAGRNDVASSASRVGTRGAGIHTTNPAPIQQTIHAQRRRVTSFAQRSIKNVLAMKCAPRVGQSRRRSAVHHYRTQPKVGVS